jgi:hypothetical protein
MLHYTEKKKNKLNTYKAVRESIQLNKIKSTIIELPENYVINDNFIFQLAEINLKDHLQDQKLSKKGKFIVKWWEN